MSNERQPGRAFVPNALQRPDRETPDPDALDFNEEIDDGDDDGADDGLTGLDKTLADSFPASDPPQAR